MRQKGIDTFIYVQKGKGKDSITFLSGYSMPIISRVTPIRCEEGLGFLCFYQFCVTNIEYKNIYRLSCRNGKVLL